MPATRPERLGAEWGTGEWVGVRRTPDEVATLDSGRLVITGDGSGLEARRPWFVGRRQRHLGATFSAVVDATDGVGGVALRLDEDHHVVVEAGHGGVTARATLSGLAREWTPGLTPGPLRLGMDLEPPSADFHDGMVGGDRIRLWAEPAAGGNRRILTELDGRYWTYEVAKSFTGRVLGAYAAEGTVVFDEIAYTGSDPVGTA